ncbi:hypothetical protein B0F90DRAFT_1670964 [Multifurca ochricompacta]|uniref:Uncharacterized protein n=1 Tax=Multifurca ochricompacta TaxID=376703 RepID=A0AAD4LW91_9AGAM|nr:hypothetical protein B0F90DRAFT_1670964 [Multifurca ochricompacta]
MDWWLEMDNSKGHSFVQSRRKELSQPGLCCVKVIQVTVPQDIECTQSQVKTVKGKLIQGCQGKLQRAVVKGKLIQMSKFKAHKIQEGHVCEQGVEAVAIGPAGSLGRGLPKSQLRKFKRISGTSVNNKVGGVAPTAEKPYGAVKGSDHKCYQWKFVTNTSQTVTFKPSQLLSHDLKAEIGTGIKHESELSQEQLSRVLGTSAFRMPTVTPLLLPIPLLSG